jgi:hypothetical protein
MQFIVTKKMDRMIEQRTLNGTPMGLHFVNKFIYFWESMRMVVTQIDFCLARDALQVTSIILLSHDIPHDHTCL